MVSFPLPLSSFLCISPVVHTHGVPKHLVCAHSHKPRARLANKATSPARFPAAFVNPEGDHAEVTRMCP